MKKALFILGTLLALSLPGISEAGSGYRHGGGGHRGYSHGGHRYHGHVYGRVYFTPYYAYPRYYPAPVYYAQPVAPVYVEQQPAPLAAPMPQGDWYYCGSARGYYPDVQNCAEGWQRIAPRP